MSLPRPDYDFYDMPIRVEGRGTKDQLLMKLKELHPEQDPECKDAGATKSTDTGQAAPNEPYPADFVQSSGLLRSRKKPASA